MKLLSKILASIALLSIPTVSLAQSQVQPVVANGTNSGGAYTTCQVGGGTGLLCPTPVTIAGGGQPLEITSATVSAPGTGYVPGTDTGLVIGGTYAIQGALAVTDTQVVAAAVAAGGSGCTNGSGKTLTGTTGTGTKVQVSATASGNAIVSIQSITVAGDYTVNPTTLTAEPVTGDSCTSAQISVTMGALKVSVSTAGNYTAIPANPVSLSSTAGAGTGSTWILAFIPVGGAGGAVTANQGTQNAGGSAGWWTQLEASATALTSTLIGSKQSLDVNVANTSAVPISATSLPLPTGASTAALQSNVQAAPSASTPATVNFVEPVDVTGAQPNFSSTVPVQLSNAYPVGAAAVSCSTGNVAATTATCTMPAASGKTTYITGFDITASGATVGLAITCTLTNTGSGTHSYTLVAAVGALLTTPSIIKSFPTPLSATATNTAPVLSCPSLGTGNTNMTINMDGYEQ